MRRVLLSLLLLLSALPLSALQYRPWYPEPLLPWVNLAYLLTTFPRVQSPDDTLNFHETAHTGRGTLIFTATDEINFQTEVAVTGTTKHSFFFDYAALMARYLLKNDVIGDPFSLSIGAALFVPSKTSRRDFATPHLGPVDFELHASIGKESVCRYQWVQRVWAMGALWWTTKSAPALRGELAVAYNLRDCVRVKAFALGLLGLGNKDLSRFRSFEGYAPYKTRAVDLGIRLTCFGSYQSALAIEYRFRPLAHNFPQTAHQLIISICFPTPL